MAEITLVDQPTKRPTRKLRAVGLVLAVLTVATYVTGALSGNEIVDQEAALNALGVLLSGGIPWVAGFLARDEKT
jgi:hypothetical protein